MGYITIMFSLTFNFLWSYQFSIFLVHFVFCLYVTYSSANSSAQLRNFSQYCQISWEMSPSPSSFLCSFLLPQFSFLLLLLLRLLLLFFFMEIFPQEPSLLLFQSIWTIFSLDLLHSCHPEISFNLPSKIPLINFLFPGFCSFIFFSLVHSFW